MLKWALILILVSAIVFYSLFFLREIILFFLRGIISQFSPKIRIEDELQKLLAGEQKILGLSDKNIKAVLIAKGRTSVRKMDGGLYLIRCVSGSTRTAVAHELFHIYDGSADAFRVTGKIIRWIKYKYWWEPRAVFYELKRLRALNRQPN